VRLSAHPRTGVAVYVEKLSSTGCGRTVPFSFERHKALKQMSTLS
jgi:hypothetical protein